MYKSSLESLLFVERELTRLLNSIRCAIEVLTPSYQWAWLQEQEEDVERYNRLDQELSVLLDTRVAADEANLVSLDEAIAATLRQKQQLDEKYNLSE